MQPKRLCTFVLALAFAASMSGAALAQGSSTSSDQSAGSSKGAKSSANPASGSMDSEFVKHAAQGGLAEVDKGNLAKSKASSDAVKQFGDRMVTDHTKANDELKTLASSKGWTLPTELPPPEKSMHTRLGKLSGAEFDKAYMRDMVRDHEKDVAEFRKCASNCSDPDLKAWAQKTAPILEDHLKSAKEVASQVGAKPSKSATAGTAASATSASK